MFLTLVWYVYFGEFCLWHRTWDWQKANILFGLKCPLLFNFNPEVHVPALVFLSPRTQKNLKPTSDKIAVHNVYASSTENGNRSYKGAQKFLN